MPGGDHVQEYNAGLKKPAAEKRAPAWHASRARSPENGSPESDAGSTARHLQSGLFLERKEDDPDESGSLLHQHGLPVETRSGSRADFPLSQCPDCRLHCPG